MGKKYVFFKWQGVIVTNYSAIVIIIVIIVTLTALKKSQSATAQDHFK